MPEFSKIGEAYAVNKWASGELLSRSNSATERQGYLKTVLHAVTSLSYTMDGPRGVHGHGCCNI